MSMPKAVKLVLTGGVFQLSYASTSKNVHWNFVIAGLAENMRNKSEEQFVMDLLGAVSESEVVNNKVQASLSARISKEITSDAPSAQPSFPASAGQVDQASLKRDFK